MKKTYDYKGYNPYGAGQMFAIDDFVDADFKGNVTEKIIKSGAGTFEVASDTEAILHVGKLNIEYCK